MLRQYPIYKVNNMQAFWACLILLLPLCANALGVRDIEVFSALNQPLDAKIGLVSVTGVDIQDIKIRLASPKVFDASNIARPYFLTRLRFKPMLAADGNAFIQISSIDAVREPYLDFMLEVSWRGGSIVKEFTVLLDPVILRGATSGSNKNTTKQANDNTPTTKKQVYGPVQEAETLWIIAQKTRPNPSIPIRQMIVAIYQENPEAFSHGNINLLKLGTTLKIPDQRSIMAITDGTASRLYRQQEQEWTNGQPTTDEPTTVGAAASAPSSATTTPTAMPAGVSTASETEPAREETTQAQPQGNAAAVVAEEEQNKLKIIAPPEGQLRETTPAQGLKVYPQDEIEQLRGSIADNTDAISALESINRDLVRLRSALKTKITLINEELERTDQAIAIVSGKLETIDPAVAQDPAADANSTTSPPAPEEQATLEETSAATPQNIDPETAETSTQLPDTLAPAPVPGSDITTDQIAAEQINRLEAEIASLKTQGETLQTQKYLIIFLTLAYLAGFAFILFSNRKHLPAVVKLSLNHLLERITKFARSCNLALKPAAPQGEIERVFEPAQPQQHPEMPFDEPYTIREEEVTFSEPPTRLSNQTAHQQLTEPAPDTGEDLATPNTAMFENHRNPGDHDLDYTLTSVDVYLAYRRFSEAESIVREAMEQHPNLPELKAKLLEIFSFKKDAKRFTLHLEKYQEELSTQVPRLWEEALQAGMQLIPNHPYIKAYTGEIHASTAANHGLGKSAGIHMGHETLMDELVISGVNSHSDDLFRVDEDELDQFELDNDFIKSNKY